MPRDRKHSSSIEYQILMPLVGMIILIIVFAAVDIFFLNKGLQLYRASSIADNIPCRIEHIRMLKEHVVNQDQREHQEDIFSLMEKVKNDFKFLVDLANDPHIANLSELAVRKIDDCTELMQSDWAIGHDPTADVHQKTDIILQQISNLSKDCSEQLHELVEEAKQVIIIDLLASLTLLFLFLWITIITTRKRLTRPIERLIKAMEKIRQGNMEDRVRIPKNKELARLARTFNAMTDAVYQSRRRLVVQRDRLEEAVEKRTLELQKLNSALRRSNQELDDFTYTVSHDLKEPLRGISSFSKFLSDEYRDQLDQDGREYIDIIRSSSVRMKNLIDDLLELSRITRKRNPRMETSLKEMLADVKASLRHLIDERNAKVILPKEDLSFVCDSIRVQQVLYNLIHNGLKFNESSEPTVEISILDGIAENAPVELANPNDFFTLVISDNGIGIDPKHFDQIFEVFQRLVGREEYEGTGAGLTIVKRVIEDHNGTIWVESQPGQGAAFFIVLPFIAPPIEEIELDQE